jgi:glycosyltransferase involved in cell wall biosynthesis/GT2 family glycosyltransferase
MKIILLAPGLARIKRGMERFFLELSGELRKAGLDATCWGTSEAPGVEAIPVPSRIELEKYAQEHLRTVPGLPAIPAQVVQNWSLYAEDQLFAIPAAMRIKQLLEKGESLVVYARWQGGLVDPSGDSTELLKTLASGIHQGRAALLVHTDWIYPPIDATLWAAGACFHSLGPWLTPPLRQQGVTPDGIVELPMCIDGLPYRSAREHRESARAELGIPPDAFVILSVGMFDLLAKRHDYVLGEISKLPTKNIWWIVAGSRGREPAAWENEARRMLGSRFIPITDVPFEKMTRLYGAADLFTSASLNETFGLVYLEAQMAGLPAVVHDTPITRHLFAQLPDALKAASLIDMRRPGAAAAAISRWMALLADPRQNENTRAALDAFASAQERQFSWNSMSPRYAAAFNKVIRSSDASTRGDRQNLARSDEQLHKQGVHLFQEGKLTDALAFIARALGARETAERWNDWATVQCVMANPHDAEQGFRRALALAPNHAQAAANLGAVLAAGGRFAEAIPLIEQSLPGIDAKERAALAQVLEACRAKLRSEPALNETEITAFLHARDSHGTGDPSRHAERISYCTALLKQIPSAAPGQRLLGIGPLSELLVPALIHFQGYKEIEWRNLRSGHLTNNSLHPEPSTASALRPTAVDATQAAFPEEPVITFRQGTASAVPLNGQKLNRLQPLGSAADAQHLDPASTLIENLPWPFTDATFDVVIFAQTLETIADDPMHAISEINRILKPNGLLILTAANIASARSLHTLLRGGTPYVDGRFPVVAEDAARHHREYTPSEIETLASAGGFGGIRILTRDILWKSLDALMPSLAASGFSVASRGDTIFLSARKESSVRDRFPARLYDLSSAQSRKVIESFGNVPMRILVIFETLPLPDGGGADHRLLQIIRLLREQGHAVTFLAPRSNSNAMRASFLTGIGVEVRIDDSEVLRQEGVDVVGKWTLQEVLREGQFDLAMISLWFWMGVTLPEHYLDEIRRLSPSTRVAILTDDCHGIREEGGAKISGLWSDRERAVDFGEREMEIYRRSDLVISISNSDKQKIARQIGAVPIDVLPMMIESGSPGPASPPWRSFDEREGIIYLGHFNNPPTLDGLEWYIREVAPLVYRELPDLKLYVVGAQLPDTWTTSDPNVVRLGFKLDLAPEFASRRILISPVRFGTGIKTKNLHALANGLPIVTNSKGAEGANFTSGETALIAHEPREFASAVIKLYSDAVLWQKLSENSRAHAEKYFSKTTMDAALRAILGRVRDLKPKPYDPAHIWSMRLVEKMFLEVLNYQPARHRHAIRVLAYARAADELIAQGNRPEARRQLRHVFNYFSHSVSRSLFFGNLVAVAESMERTYRILGESNGAEEFRREARQFSASAFAESAPAPASSAPSRSAELVSAPSAVPDLSKTKPRRDGQHPTKLDLSVILPTYNRADVLAECLGALNTQSLSSHRFEVIVVDDGSTDRTHALCSRHKPRHEFHFLNQQNAGAGAARRLGVERARGKFLLLINDDTIASRELLAQHLELQRVHAQEKLAVLGNFFYPQEAKNRALTWFLSSQPFLFPQVGLKAGIYANHSFFITCNVSVRRDAVLAVGSFDPNFRVAEDTELGIRLIQKGLKVLYAPELQAVHQHLDFTISDLLHRAEVYGNKLVNLFKKHPGLVADGKGVLGKLDANSLDKISSFVEEHEPEIPAAVDSLSKFDTIDFFPFFSKQIDGKNAAEAVMDLFSRSIPTVYWYHLFRSFLAARETDLNSKVSATNSSLGTQSADA